LGAQAGLPAGRQAVATRLHRSNPPRLPAGEAGAQTNRSILGTTSAYLQTSDVFKTWYVYAALVGVVTNKGTYQ